MKRICCIIGLLGAALHLLAWNDTDYSIDLNKLYIVGDATPSSWDLGKAEAMHSIDNGVFEWTGRLIANKEFKFMNTNDGWHKHIVGTKPDQTVNKDELYPLYFYATWTLEGKYDMKFRVADTGIYTVYVDLNAMQMKITEPVVAAQWPEKFYITGSAVDDRIIEIPEYNGVEHKIVVPLKHGSVKIIDTPAVTDQTHYYHPLFEDVDILFGKGYHSSLFTDDDREPVGWNVTLCGDYSLYFDKVSKTYNFQKYQPRKILYLVGGCCEKAWNYWDDSNNKFYPSPENPDILVWEGELRIGWDKSSGKMPDEPTKFKILTAPDWFGETYHPYIADAPASGTSGARISGGDDLKWCIDRDGYYRLELNTRDETLTGIMIEPNAIVESNPTIDTAAMNMVDRDNNEEISYYNLQGNPVSESFKGIVIAHNRSGAIKYIRQ